MKIKQAKFVSSFVALEQLPPEPWPEIALVGRSNVGKSSMINRIVNRKGLAKSSSTPGKTRMINYYLIDDAWHLVDLPGYGYAKVAKSEQLKWGKLIEKFLSERQQLKGVILLLDIRHEPNANDIMMKNWLVSKGIPILAVAVKADKVARGSRLKNLKAICRTLEIEDQGLPLVFSAETGEGAEELKASLAEILELD